MADFPIPPKNRIFALLYYIHNYEAVILFGNPAFDAVGDRLGAAYRQPEWL